MTAPSAQGLYRPEHEHDSCGVAFVADLAGRRSTTWCEGAARRWAGWTTGAPAAPSRTPVTAPAS